MDPDDRQAQEVNDRIAHFFFLVDQQVDHVEGQTLGLEDALERLAGGTQGGAIDDELGCHD